MLVSKKVLIVCVILLFQIIYKTEAVVGLGILYALTPGAALGGLVTGIIGVVLGGVSIAVALDKLDLTGDKDDKKKKDEAEMSNYGYYYQQQPSYYNQQPNGYYSRRRYRRDTTDQVHEKITEERVQLEFFLDKVYFKDTSQCLEKLICNISRRTNQGSNISSEEEDILKLIQHNILHGYMYKKMLVSQKVGKAGGDCEFLYSTCPIPASQMLFYIRESSRRVERSMR